LNNYIAGSFFLSLLSVTVTALAVYGLVFCAEFFSDKHAMPDDLRQLGLFFLSFCLLCVITITIFVVHSLIKSIKRRLVASNIDDANINNDELKTKLNNIQPGLHDKFVEHTKTQDDIPIYKLTVKIFEEKSRFVEVKKS
jgi:hypothetical protein